MDRIQNSLKSVNKVRATCAYVLKITEIVTLLWPHESNTFLIKVLVISCLFFLHLYLGYEISAKRDCTVGSLSAKGDQRNKNIYLYTQVIKQ